MGGMNTNETGSPASPWHAGEVAIQASVGAAEQMAELGRRVVRDHLIEQHRQFFPQLPFVVMGTVDRAGDPWATLRANHPGFLQSPDPLHLQVDVARDAADPADEGMAAGDAIALLGIELHTRRRNRLNGVVERSPGAPGFSVAVQQSYGNCPKYIQLRDFEFHRDPSAASPPRASETDHLDDAARAVIASADTFFVATYVDDPVRGRQVDVSHRGGKAGFVRVGADGVLTVPDFVGNYFFNTLGNIVENPKAGLVFVDFETGDLLQLTGSAAVLLDSPETATFEGAQRLWTVTPRRVIRRPGALPLRWAWRDGGWSPFVLRTGDWAG
jgi:predicted pyridoxine 5'-phosphate oxidase superfamily flavin-nucleotide-binding protein